MRRAGRRLAPGRNWEKERKRKEKSWGRKTAAPGKTRKAVNESARDDDCPVDTLGAKRLRRDSKQVVSEGDGAEFLTGSKHVGCTLDRWVVV
jgi:hypothetical protein